MNTVVDKIALLRKDWYVMGYPEPDTVIIPTEDYYKMITEVNSEMAHPFNLSVDGRNKVFGLDIVPSSFLDTIKICKTKW